MTSKALYQKFNQEFDLVGIIDKNTYMSLLKKHDKFKVDIPYETVVVLGLSYPKRIIHHTQTHLVPSFYTFGKDYHLILKKRVDKVLKDIPFKSYVGIDNHPYDERIAAVGAGLGFFGKNQLIINQSFGSYVFLGLVFLDTPLDKEIVLSVDDDCGRCTKCIDACPPKALSEIGYDMFKCISYYNQAKNVLTDEQIKHNYALFGCDICQLVCPKNATVKMKAHDDFILNGKEYVSIMDLFLLSEKQFKEKYDQMAYLWKGKTVLMRNALTLIKRHKMTQYIPMIKSSLKRVNAPWYEETTHSILEDLMKLKNKEE